MIVVDIHPNAIRSSRPQWSNSYWATGQNVHISKYFQKTFWEIFNNKYLQFLALRASIQL
jgi:hypothetical protein